MGEKDLKNISYVSGKLNNHKLSMDAGEEVTYNILESAADTLSSPYVINYNFGRAAITVTIRATAACSLTEHNGKVQKSPITINPGNNKIEVETTSFKIVSSASTVLEVTIK